MTVTNTFNEKISVTAYMVAKGRTFSNIPYSREIFDAIETMGLMAGNSDSKTSIELAPRFEARYKMTNHLLEQNGAEQILEIASGLTPRGLEFSEKPNIKYVEMDLPGILKIKEKIIESIVQKNELGIRSNLHLIAGNVLNVKDLEQATKFFDPSKACAIVNEGLLRYLSFQEKKDMARNIGTILKRFGGVWITPDITLRKDLSPNQTEYEQNEKVKREIGVDMNANNFESVDKAQEFFEKCGFFVERHALSEVVDQLVSPINLNLSLDKIKERVGKGSAFVMKVM